MQDFQYHRPGSAAEAIAKVKDAEEGKFMAGGQSLIPLMKLDLAAPTDVVSLAGVKELSGIRVEGERLAIGAAVTHSAVAASAVVEMHIPALAALAGRIGDPQVRNRGTLGGSIAHNDPAADYPAALVALGATVQTDRREIAAEDFFTGMFETALSDGELIHEVSFPIPEKAAYEKLPNPASRFAIVGVFVAKSGASVRVAVVGAGTNVFRATALEEKLAASFTPDALSGVSIPADDLVTDSHAAADYRAHLVPVMARRAVASMA